MKRMNNRKRFVLPVEIITTITGNFLEMKIQNHEIDHLDIIDWYGVTKGPVRRIVKVFKSFVLQIQKAELEKCLKKLPKELFSARVDFFHPFPKTFIKQNLESLSVLYGHDFGVNHSEYPKFVRLRRLVAHFPILNDESVDYINEREDLRVLMIQTNKSTCRKNFLQPKLDRFLYLSQDYSHGFRNGPLRLSFSSFVSVKFIMLFNVVLTEKKSLELITLPKIKIISMINCTLGTNSHHLFEHPGIEEISLNNCIVTSGCFDLVKFPTESGLRELGLSKSNIRGKNFPHRFFESLVCNLKHLIFLDLLDCHVEENFVEVIKKRNKDGKMESVLDVDITGNPYFIRKIDELNKELGEKCKVRFLNVLKKRVGPPGLGRPGEGGQGRGSSPPGRPPMGVFGGMGGRGGGMGGPPPGIGLAGPPPGFLGLGRGAGGPSPGIGRGFKPSGN